MKSDLEFRKVENIAIAITPEETEDDSVIYTAWLLNLKDYNLQNILIRSKAHGEIDQQEVETSTLRSLIENLAAQSFIKIDSFQKEASALSNEYWVSFNDKNYMYDKKFVFVPESIISSNFIQLPLLDRMGVMIA